MTHFTNLKMTFFNANVRMIYLYFNINVCSIAWRFPTRNCHRVLLQSSESHTKTMSLPFF